MCRVHMCRNLECVKNFDTWTEGSKTDSRTEEMQKAVKGNESGEGIVRGRIQIILYDFKSE